MEMQTPVQQITRLTPATIAALGALITAANLFVEGFQDNKWIPVLRSPPIDTLGGVTTVGLTLAFLLTTWLLVRLQTNRDRRPPKLGQILVMLNRLSRECLESALKECRRGKSRLGAFLVDNNYATERDIEAALKYQEQLGILMKEV